MSVEVDICDDVGGEGGAGGLGEEVLNQQLLIRRVEPESWWQVYLLPRPTFHLRITDHTGKGSGEKKMGLETESSPAVVASQNQIH